MKSGLVVYVMISVFVVLSLIIVTLTTWLHTVDEAFNIFAFGFVAGMFMMFAIRGISLMVEMRLSAGGAR